MRRRKTNPCKNFLTRSHSQETSNDYLNQSRRVHVRHASQDDALPASDASGIYLRVEDSPWIRDHCGQESRFVGTEGGGRFVKIVLRRSLCAINAVTPLNLIQIEFENPSLGQQPFKKDC